MRTLVIFLIIFSPFILPAQNFTKITDSPVTSDPADSRACGFVDVNNDGWEDIFITNGPSGGQNNALYLNDGTGQFIKIEDDSFTSDNSSSDGAAFADADNDGDPDALVVTWYGQINYFYQNNGDGSFSHLPDAVTGNTGTFSEATSWGDYDNDGWADVLITNSDGNKRNLLYKNIDGTEFDKVNESPFSTDINTSRSISWTDYDLDNDLDLYICNENNEKNNLYQNDGQGNFIKITNTEITADFNSSMSSSWGDIDNDGDLDLFVANARYFQEADNQLFINNGDGTFTQSSTTVFEEDGGCSYSSSFADIDNDADLDLLVTNGYCNSNLQEFLYVNDGLGNFSRSQGSLPDLPARCSYGCAWGDFNNDGFLDLVIAHCKNNSSQGAPENSLYQNNGNDNHWLKIELKGTISNKSAIGAKVKVKAEIDGEPVWQVREITTQSGHCSQNSMKAHFGLKNAVVVDSLIIEWPSGIKMKEAVLPVDTCLIITEDISDATIEFEKAIGSFSCFPNPVKESINIKAHFLKPVKTVQINMIDLQGRSIYKQMYSSAETLEFSKELNMKNIGLSPGIYFCRLEVDGALFTRKIILKP